MVSAFPLHRYTLREYLELEEMSPTKHEFLDGEILAMAGGTPKHAALGMAAGVQLSTKLAGTKCRVFSSDLRVQVSETGLTTYPDVTVVCGPTQSSPESESIVVNPRVVVEVTSDGTEHYDRGAKLEHYQKIPTLDAVVIVSHRETRVEVWTRAAAGFVHTNAVQGQRAMIAPLDIELDVDALYAAVAEPPA